MTIQAFKLQIIGASIANASATLAKGRVILTLQSLGIIGGAGGGVIIPSSVEVVLSASGLGSADLYTDGTSQYLVEIYDINGRKAGEWQLTMPLSNCYLHDVIGVLPVGTLTQAQAAIVAAQSYVAQASAFSDSSGAYAVQAQGYRDTTLTYRDAASASATAASGSATAAAGSATAASTSKDAAAASATLAQQWATNLTAVPGGGGLFGSRYYANLAQTSQTAAAQAVIDSGTYAGQASASAIQAQGYNASALGYSNLAQQWATSTAVVAGGFYGALKYAQDAAAAVQSATDQANLAKLSSDSAQGAQAKTEEARGIAAQFMVLAQQAAASGAATFQQMITQFASMATLTIAATGAQASASTAGAQASLAQSAALSAISVAAQDLSGTVTAAALHRSPNAVTALFVYDTSKDSDGGAWVERMGATSWMNEALNGTWLPSISAAGWASELNARAYGATTGAELIANQVGWTPGAGWASASGTQTATATTANDDYANVSLVTGQLYVLTYTIASIASGQLSLNLDAAAGTIRSTPGTYQEVLVGTVTSATAIIRLQPRNGSSVTASITGVSVKPVTAFNTKSGDYYQLASDGKFYRLWRNVLRNVDDLTNVTWAKADTTITADQAAGVDGLMTMDLLTEGSAGTAGITSAGYAAGGVLVASAVNLKRGNHDWVRVRIVDNTTNAVNAWFNLNTGATGTVTVGGAATNASSAIVNLGGGIYRCIVSGNVPGTGISINHMSASADASTARVAGGTRYADKHYMQVGVTAATIGAHEAKGDDTSQTETFRGNSAKFPKQVAIVAEAAASSFVTLYDLTQPGRPMWMRFVANGNGMLRQQAGSVAMVNGELVIGSNMSTGDIHRINFLKDGSVSWADGGGLRTYVGNIAQRNANLGNTFSINPGGSLANRWVNAVAMTVLPNAPVDPVTGLQVPTIAVAVGTGNAGNIGTVLMNDGTAVNYTQPSNDGTSVGFTAKGEVTWGISTGSGLYVMPLAATGPVALSTATRSYGNGTIPWTGPLVNKAGVVAGKSLAIFPRQSGTGQNTIYMVRENPSTPGAGMGAIITGTYSTGHHLGDIRRSLAADTVAGTAGANLLTGDNSTFTTGIGTWATPFQSTAAATGGQAVVTATGANPYFTQTLAVTPGKSYRLGFDYVAKSAGVTLLALRIGDNTGLASAQLYGPVNQNLGSGQSVDFVANSTGIAFIQFAAASGVGDTFTLDNVTVKEIVADRSVKGKASSINGTLAMTAVASAAQLVAYSGFTNDPAQTSELVLNGTFATNVASWNNGTGTIAWDATSGGRALVTNTTAFVPGANSSVFPTVVGRKYTLNLSAVAGTGSPRCSIDIAGGTGHISTGQMPFTFTATSTQHAISLYSDTAGGTTFWDNISVKPADAIGSAANVIQESAWSADLDPGTAAFVPGMGWFNVPSTGFGPANWIRNSTFAGASAGVNPTGYVLAQSGGGMASTISGVGVEGGMAYIDLRCQGTATTTGAALQLNFDTAGFFPAAASGQTWTGSFYARISAGALSTANVQARVFEMDSGNVQLLQSDGATLTGAEGTLTRLNVTRTLSQATAARAGLGMRVAVINGTTYDFTIRVALPQLERGASMGLPVATSGTAFNGIAPMIDRSGPNGAYYRAGIDGNGFMAVELSDGTTTRRVTSTVACNDGNWHQLLATYSAGAVTLFLDGAQNAQATGAALLTLNNANALLTLGNSFALNAAFPGSLALVRTGATVPFAEQIAFAYSQERAMFQPGVQVALPDTGAVVDLSYDDLMDRVKGATAANEFSFTGLVRVESGASAAGSISKVAMRSGMRLVARTGTNPGVDVAFASINLREALLRRAEEARRADRPLQVLDIDSVASQTDFVLPLGHELVEACSAGALKREGATKDFTRLFDGFKETVRFGTQQGTNWVQLKYRRAA